MTDSSATALKLAMRATVRPAATRVRGNPAMKMPIFVLWIHAITMEFARQTKTVTTAHPIASLLHPQGAETVCANHRLAKSVYRALRIAGANNRDRRKIASAAEMGTEAIRSIAAMPDAHQMDSPVARNHRLHFVVAI